MGRKGKERGGIEGKCGSKMGGGEGRAGGKGEVADGRVGGVGGGRRGERRVVEGLGEVREGLAGKRS